MARPKKYQDETEVVSFRVPKSLTKQIRKVVDDILNPKVPERPMGWGHPIADKIQDENWQEEIRKQIAQLQKEIYEVPKSYSETGKIIWVKERNKKIQELKNQLR